MPKRNSCHVCGLQVHLGFLVRRVPMVLQVKLDPKDLLVSQVRSAGKHSRKASHQLTIGPVTVVVVATL